MVGLSAGSPLTHPRLSMVRPLWGRRPRCVAWIVVGSACGRAWCIFAGVGPPWGPNIYALSFRGRASLTRGYRIVRLPWGRRPRGVSSGGGGLPLRVGVRLCGRVAVCAICHSVNADTHRRPRFSVGKAARWGARGDPSHGFWFPSHGLGVPSLGFSLPRLVSDGKLGPNCVTWWRKWRFWASVREGCAWKCLNVRWFCFSLRCDRRRWRSKIIDFPC